jgi:hypothetical protein
VQIATEGAEWGSIHAHGFLSDAVLPRDDAGQFAVEAARNTSHRSSTDHRRWGAERP